MSSSFWRRSRVREHVDKWDDFSRFVHVLTHAATILFLISAFAGMAWADDAKLVDALKSMPDVLSTKQRRAFRRATHQLLRARGQKTNQADIASWRNIKTRQDWEKFRDERLARLRKSLRLPKREAKPLRVRVTKTYRGDRFTIENVLYETRPNFWVAANLYVPVNQPAIAPALILVHSHHRPKTQGELQDMGMTWARRGCFVLVIDQVGHGERADHPFQGKQDYPRNPKYRWWRQDYFHRANTNQQLHVTGESLMGWFAWDLMCGVGLLRARPQIDKNRIIILGAVAGGGDPAGVTAALDKRIAAAVPFNFGGPQPENKYPLPGDAGTSFNYLGGAYWDNTRNLRRTAADGFLHWVIVGGIAPRPVVYAHEFSWDRLRDPVWKRLNRIYQLYGKPKNIDYTLGAGSVRGSSSKDTHCTNIGAYHRRRIHLAFRRWFNIDVKPEHEYRRRLTSAELHCWTPELRKKLQPAKLHQLLHKTAGKRIQQVQQANRKLSPAERRTKARNSWRELLGQIDPKGNAKVESLKRTQLPTDVTAERIVLRTEPGIVLPILLLRPKNAIADASVIVGVASKGIRGFLKTRAEEISVLMKGGRSLCLLDVRHAAGSTHQYALFFDTPVVGYQLRDLRATLKYLRTRKDMGRQFLLWGDSLAKWNSFAANFKVPYRVRESQPPKADSLGGMLAMLAALFEDDVKAVYVGGGLSSFRHTLISPHVRMHSVIPHVIPKGDLPELAGALAPRPLRLDVLVDGLNRLQLPKDVRATYLSARQAYNNVDANEPMTVRTNTTGMLRWLLIH